MPSKRQLDPFHVGIAAEAFAAGLFAQCGCNVLVQYGANQPEYDFVAEKGRRTLHVSVKGSQDEGWGLIQNYKSGHTYHEAADLWLADQAAGVVFCLVQFAGVAVGEMPRAYLATAREIAARHKESRGGEGSTILYEDRTYARGIAAGVRDAIPAAWRFSESRVKQFLERAS
jgi:Holliday junction resolvase-like predicted endonuclease